MAQNLVFNFSKLKGRIREVLGSQEKFAEALGYSNVTLSRKLNNKIQFSVQDIARARRILEIEPKEISDYFFTES